MNEKAPRPQDRSPIVIHKFLGNTLELYSLLDDDKRTDSIARVQKVVKGFTSDEVTSLAGKLIYAQSQENKFWNVDRRDGALELLKNVPVARAKPEALRDIFVLTVHRQGEETDPLDTAEAVINAGEIIFSCFPEDKKTQDIIGSALYTLVSKIEDTSIKSTLEQKISQAKILFEPHIPKKTSEERPVKKKRKRVSNAEVAARRQQVEKLSKAGKTNKEIAEALSVTPYRVSMDRIFLEKRGKELAKMKYGKTIPPETTERRQQVAKYVAQGMSQKNIAMEMQVPLKIIRTDFLYLKRYGLIDRSVSPKVAARRDQVVDLLGQDKDPDEIAKTLHVSRTTIYHDIYFLKAKGLV